MSADSRALVELIRKVSGTYGNTFVKVFDAVVKSVDEDSRTCVVDSLSSDNQIENLTVRFMLDVSDGDLSVPEINSTVSVALNDYTEPYIVSSTWITKKEWVVGNSSFTIEKDLQKFNDGEFGGIPIVKDPDNSNNGLLKKYNNLEQKFNEILSILKATVIPLAPSGTYPFASLYSSVNPLSITTENQISNPDITHGKKLD